MWSELIISLGGNENTAVGSLPVILGFFFMETKML